MLTKGSDEDSPFPHPQFCFSSSEPYVSALDTLTRPSFWAFIIQGETMTHAGGSELSSQLAAWEPHPIISITSLYSSKAEQCLQQTHT